MFCRFKLHLFLHNPTSADDKSWEIFPQNFGRFLEWLRLVGAEIIVLEAYDNRLKGKQLYIKEWWGIYGVMGILISLTKASVFIQWRREKTPQGNLLLNQLEIEWKSILLFRTVFGLASFDSFFIPSFEKSCWGNHHVRCHWLWRGGKSRLRWLMLPRDRDLWLQHIIVQLVFCDHVIRFDSSVFINIVSGGRC